MCIGMELLNILRILYSDLFMSCPTTYTGVFVYIFSGSSHCMLILKFNKYTFLIVYSVYIGSRYPISYMLNTYYTWCEKVYETSGCVMCR